MQEIIVYRSPMEAAFWEMASNGDLIPPMGGALVALLVMVMFNRLVEKARRWLFGRSMHDTFKVKVIRKFVEYGTPIMFALGAASAVITFNILFI